MKLLHALRKRLRRKPRKQEVRFSDPVEIEPGLRLAASSDTRFWLPTRLVCMHGAWRYAHGWHPFTAALADPRTLPRFYESFRPTNLAEMYFLPATGLAGETLPPWTLPWLQTEGNAPAPEMGLGLEHGVSYYGPATPEKLALEERRLKGTLGSIQRSGYDPDAHDDITGWFLRRGDEWRFFVRGGKHRAAVLAHLGWEHVPVILRDPTRPVIVAEQKNDWPLVREGRLAPELASSVFDRYFDWNGLQQRHFLAPTASA